MYCYKVVDDVVLVRSFRKKCTTSADVVRAVKESTGEEKVLSGDDFLEERYTDMYDACKQLTCLADEFEGYSWFVSANNSYVLAAALLRVFSKEGLWNVMQDKATFDDWVSKNVR